VKLAIFFIISFLLTSLLAADATYLLVAKTKDRSVLPYIKSKLAKIKLGMLVYKTKSEYSVYSGAFKNHDEASKALMVTQHYFPNASIVSFKTNIQEKEKTQSADSAYFFINASIAYLNLPYEYSVQTEGVTLNAIDTKGLGYIVEAGYNFENNIFLTIGAMSFTSNANSITNIYSSFNYKVLIDNFEPYIGILAGLSTLSWSKPPIPDSSSSSSSSLLYGLQGGLNYNTGFNDLTLFLNYQYSVINYKTPLTIVNQSGTIASSSSLTQNLIHGLNIGVQYRF